MFAKQTLALLIALALPSAVLAQAAPQSAPPSAETSTPAVAAPAAPALDSSVATGNDVRPVPTPGPETPATLTRDAAQPTAANRPDVPQTSATAAADTASAESRPPKKAPIKTAKPKTAKPLPTALAPAPKPVASTDPDAEEPAVTHTEDLLQFLDQVITWQRSVASFEPSSRNPRSQLIHDALVLNANRLLRLAFDFARARAATLPAEETAGNATSEQTATRAEFVKRAEEIDQKIVALKAEAAALPGQLRRAKRAQRAGLRARQQGVAVELKLALAQQNLMNTVRANWATSDVSGVGEQIEALARTVPELQGVKSPATTPAVDTATGEPDASPDTGILGLAGEMLSYTRKKTEIADLSTQAEAIHAANEQFVAALKVEYQAIVARGTAIAKDIGSVDDAERARRQAEMDGLMGRFQALSKTALPISQSNVWLESSQRNIDDWKRSIDREFRRDLYTLTVRLAILGATILIPLLIGEFVRRASGRYIRDMRRRRQVAIVRRVVVSLLVVVIVLLSLVTEFGSLATFAGFLTAGLAVALQNVILSVVAYFFYFSRYGIRPGNRVTIGGTTGEVVEVGIVRLHLMELSGSGWNAHPTGNIVSFPNSVLFNAAPFAKELSGSDYAWHEITLTFAPDTDDEAIETRMKTAVETVYADYAELARPISALEQLTHAVVPTPQPRTNLRWSGDGIAWRVAYPVEGERASFIDYRLSRALVAEAAKEPKLTLVATRFPA